MAFNEKRTIILILVPCMQFCHNSPAIFPCVGHLAVGHEATSIFFGITLSGLLSLLEVANVFLSFH